MASSVLHMQQQLPPGSNFSEAFWDRQNKGVEIIMSRLRKSKDTCEEIKKLYELRATIEQDYGERLLKLASSSRIGEFGEDSFAETLSRIPSALETTARAHIDLAQQLKDHLETPLDGFLKDQRDVRKMQQQQIENSKQLKNLHEADVARARDYYSIECSKLTSMEKYYFNLPTEEIEKEIEEQRRMVTVADQVYKRSVDNFNSVNEKWVNDWTTSAEKFQEMEIKRISYLRSTLWSFANMMTSTFSIDEECCDRIRTALEITDVEKDITGFVQRYGTGTRVPAPLPYEVLYLPPPKPITTTSSTIPIVSAETAADFVIKPTNNDDHVTDTPSIEVLPEPTPANFSTNPDEELKSVDRQLEQIETIPSSQDDLVQIVEQELEEQPLTSITNTTDQSNGPVSSAIREVENILNEPILLSTSKKEEILDNLKTRTVTSNRASYASNTQTIPPIMMARSIHSGHGGNNESDDFSNDIYNALGISSNNTHDLETKGHKYKPMPNPIYNNNATTATATDETSRVNNVAETIPVVGVRTSSLLIANSKSTKPSLLSLEIVNKVKQQQEEEEEEVEEDEYQNRMPRLPPKDEKWVISSIRGPQQLPVRTLNARMFDGTASVSRNSVISSSIEQQEEQHHPKVHRPVIPLTIDIPNSIKPTPDLPQNAAQQVIAEGRKISQMSPIQHSHNQNGLEDGGSGIRPAPWTEEDRGNTTTPTMTNNPTSPYGYQPGPRGSSLKLSSNQDIQQLHIKQQLHLQQQQFEEENKKRFNKKYSESSIKSKDNTKGARFSLGFFINGNKKEKKKEKEAAANANASYNNQQVDQQQHMPQQQRPQQPQEQLVQSDLKSNIQSPPQSFDRNRFIVYAKAQWPFEANIEGEMSFRAEEVVGIIRKQADGWWEAERLEPPVAGQRGLIPGNYMVEIFHPSSLQPSSTT